MALPAGPFRSDRALVVGVGKGAGHIIDQIHDAGSKVIDTMYVGTDEPSVLSTRASVKFLIGKRLLGGKGAMGYSDLGERAAEDAKRDFEPYFKGYNLIIIVGTLGKGTGSGAMPVIASTAESQGAFVMNIIHIPSGTLESLPRTVANHTRNGMVRRGFNVLTIDQERFLEMNGKEPFSTTLSKLNGLTSAIVRTFVEVIYGPARRGLTISDLRTVFKQGNEGSIFLGGGTFGTELEAAREFVSCGLNNRDPRTGKGVILNIVTPSGIPIANADPFVEAVMESLGKGKRTVFVGNLEDPDKKDDVDLIGIITGMDDGKVDLASLKKSSSSAIHRQPPPAAPDRWEIPMVH